MDFLLWGGFGRFALMAELFVLEQIKTAHSTGIYGNRDERKPSATDSADDDRLRNLVRS